MSVTVRPLEPHDAPRWRELYDGYREFYELTPDDAVVDRVWQWLRDPANEVTGLVAVDADGLVVALAHYRRFHRPSSGTVGLYLDDLFTDPAARGTGAATALLTTLGGYARELGPGAIVRWITASSNSAARRVYDRVATATPWVTYDLRP